MPRVAFLTDQLRPHGTADDQLVVRPLAALGVDVLFVPWEIAEPDATIDAWVIRSPWNYAANAGAFLDRLSRLRPLHNSLETVRWNADKRYLLELAESGVPIIPSVVAPLDALAEVVEATGWAEVVVKPCVSAGGVGVRRLSAAEAGNPAAFSGLPGGDYLVQPFLNDVLAGGEVSLVYFGGEFSHAVRKRPAEGNFLVHEEHGGRLDFVFPDADVLQASAEALAAAGATGPYARVDWIQTDRGPLLVELELIEPELFLRVHPLAPERFAAAIVAAMGGR